MCLTTAAVLTEYYLDVLHTHAKKKFIGKLAAGYVYRIGADGHRVYYYDILG